MKISPLQKHHRHFGVVAKWLFDEWSPISPFETFDGTLDALEARARGHLIPSTYVAEESGVPLGTVSVVECDFPSRHEWSPWLADMYVDPGSRNRGIGSALAIHVESLASEAGISELYLITRHQSRFYARIGWSVIERIQYQGEAAALMRRELT